MFTHSAEFYDAIYSFRDYAAETAQIAGLVRSAHPDARTMLDVACGTGEHARLLARDHGFEVDGLDLDTTLLGIARRKHSTGRFFEGDMSDFSLAQRYDGVVCLFSSIGYLVTVDRLRRTLQCFRRHLEPGGVVIVEPWFPPGVIEADRVMRHTGEVQGLHVERVSHIEVDGRLSHLHFDYRFEGPDGVSLAKEVHELGLFTTDEVSAAFRAAGLTADYDAFGLTGRGLWVGRIAR